MCDGARYSAGELRLPSVQSASIGREWQPEGPLDRAWLRVAGAAKRIGGQGYAASHRGYLRRIRRAARPAPDLDDAALCRQARQAGARLRARGIAERGELATLMALLGECSIRTLGLYPHDVQFVGARVILEGRLAEMATGEGKSLVAAIAAAASGLSGLPVHVVTVNDYLARRDADWVRPLMRMLGLGVGVVTLDMAQSDKPGQYAQPVCYCTGQAVAFDYLRSIRASQQVPGASLIAADCLMFTNGSAMRLPFAIVDEADSVMIDEARTPLILSEGVDPAVGDDVIAQVMVHAGSLRDARDFKVNRSKWQVDLTGQARARLAADLAGAPGGPLTIPALREELVRQALSALHLYRRDEHYLVRDEKIEIIDEYTGRIMPDRSWSAGLHQMVEYKEGCPLTAPRATVARLTYQQFYRRYRKLSGISGTATEVRSEFWQVYGLTVHRIPTHARCVRRVAPDRILPDREAKWRVLTERVCEIHATGAPVLIGARTVAATDEIRARLEAAGLECEILHAAQDKDEAGIVARAGQQGRITVATNMAGRGTDIALGKGAADLGGLHVVMTERHDSRRIDRQLMGRCARQGDPGHFEAILSLDDPLGRLVRPQWLLQLARLGLPVDRGLLACRVLAWGQRTVERQHSRARAALLRQDHATADILAFSGALE